LVADGIFDTFQELDPAGAMADAGPVPATLVAVTLNV
jgi:hypothetical protein